MVTTKAQLHNQKMIKLAEGKTLLDATHVWMKRWPCVIIDGDPNKRLCRIVYFPEHDRTKKTHAFALPQELETIAEAVERTKSSTTSTNA